MIKRLLLAVGVALALGWLLTTGPAFGFVQGVVELPTELAGVIAGAVFFLVSLALQGRIPDEHIEEIAGVITTALLAVIGVALRMIPPQFELIATALLNLLVIILGMVAGVKLLYAGGRKAFFALEARLS